MNFLKYLPLLLQGRSIAAAYKEETGAGKPFYLSRRLIGLIITLIGAVVSLYFGVTLDSAILASIADNVVTVISAIVTLYGVVIGVIGVIKKDKQV